MLTYRHVFESVTSVLYEETWYIHTLCNACQEAVSSLDIHLYT